MGLIKCPDCEKQISENAKQCIHCGCVFQVCPECGTVLAGEHEFCPECGFQLEKKEKIEDSKPMPETKDEKRLMFWYALADKKPPIRVFASVVGWFAVAIFAFAVFATFATEKFVELFFEVLLKFFLLEGTTVVDVVGYLWIAFTALVLIWELIIRFSASDAQRFRQFAEEQNLNLPELINNEFKCDFEKNARPVLIKRYIAIFNAIEAILLKKDALYENRVKRSNWWAFWGNCIFMISFCVCAIANSKAYITCIGDFNYLKDWQWGYVFFCVAVGVVGYVIDTIVERCDKKKNPTHTGWMQENLPQYLDAYTQLEKIATTIDTSVGEKEDDY